MKFSEAWLREWANPSVDSAALRHQLTMAGLEVDDVEPVAAVFNNVVVAQIKDIQPHPDADKLTVCTVDVGESAPLQIVCGAKNVSIGLKVPAALVGAVFESGLKIKKSKLRGVESFGMMCSAVELGIAEESDGLFALPEDATVGLDIREYLGLDDKSFDVDLTPNRGDCLSVAGIAREVAAINQCELTTVDVQAVNPVIEDQVNVDFESLDACTHYVGRVIKNINMQAKSPIWLKEQLRRSGLRSISPVVDVTNYVMLELGQPMHAFDLNAVKDGVVVRLAKDGEKITLLDEKEVSLKADTVVIADQSNPIAIAGIMGGFDSAVTDKTKDIFLESAHFTPDSVAGHAREYGLSTDSSHRFERGVDPTLQAKAVERATALLLDIVGGEVGPVVSAGNPEESAVVITLRTDRVNQLLGLNLPTKEIEDHLVHLGLLCEKTNDGFKVTVPFFRFDLRIEVDLIEEVARLHGYDNIPTTQPRATIAMSSDQEGVVKLSRFQTALCDAGYHEAVTYSFVDDAIQKTIDPLADGVALLNPISSEMSVMRTTLLPGLLSTVKYNQNRQQDRVRLFETGMCFLQGKKDLAQVNMLAGVISGSVLPTQWSAKVRPVDFFDLKGDVQQLLSLTHDASSFSFKPTSHTALHPGQGADILRDGKKVGFVGLLHPRLYKALGVQGPCGVFELELSTLQAAAISAYSAISKFPHITRDLAFVLDEGIPLADILTSIKSAAGDMLINTNLFDRYDGEGIPEGSKSLALTLTMQDVSRTLTDDEVNSLVDRVTTTLAKDFSADLRD